jgi:Tfx family DNA-binding protein
VSRNFIRLGKQKRLHYALKFAPGETRLTKFKPPRTVLTARQWQVIRLRATGLTQSQVARRLHTSRENVSIIEHRAHENVKSAKATLEALEHLSDSGEVLVPSGTSVFEATSIILRRADALGIKVKISADSILSLLRTRCRGKLRLHHLTSVIRVQISKEGSIVVN